MTDCIIIILYIVLVTAVGVASGIKKKTSDGFFSSDGKNSLFTSVAVLTSGFIGGGYSIGNAAGCFTHGLAYALTLCGFSVGMILFTRLLLPRIKTGKTLFSAVADAYGRPASRFVAFFSVLFCLGILAAQLYAMSGIISEYFVIPKQAAVLLSAAVVIIYSTVGGFASVVKTDIIHFIVLAVGLALLFFFSRFAVLNEPSKSLDITPLSPLAFIGLFIAFATGEMITPMLVTRITVSKDRKKLSTALVISSILAAAFFLMTGFIGISSKAINLTDAASDALTAAASLMPSGLRGLVGAGFLAVLLSSADGALNSATAAVTDELLSLSPSFRFYMPAARVINVLAGLFAAFAVCILPDVTGLLMLSYKFWSPVAISQLVASLSGKRGDALEFILPAVLGILTVLLWDTLLKTPYGIPSAAVGTVVNVLSFIVIKKLPRKRRGAKRKLI